MIDNFELIKEMFYFNEANNMFFHCQIVRRAKDHKPNKVKEGAIKTYFIKSKEHLELLKEEIILLCEHYGARAYINVAGKDFSSLNSLLLLKLANDNNEGIVRNPRKILNSAAGELKSRTPRWVIDVDDINQSEDILKWLDDYFKEIRFKFLYATIPTKAGLHFITKPFNTKEFSKTFPNVDIHKNSMGTLLYYPDSINSIKTEIKE